MFLTLTREITLSGNHPVFFVFHVVASLRKASVVREKTI